MQIQAARFRSPGVKTGH